MRKNVWVMGIALALALLPACDEEVIGPTGDATPEVSTRDVASGEGGSDSSTDASADANKADGDAAAGDGPGDGLMDGPCQGDASRPCYTGIAGTKGVGECVAGTQLCVAGKWGECTGQVTPAAETCDGKDNDCNGATDDLLTKACYTGTAGTSGVGLCKDGVQICMHGSWGACNGEVTPTAETCDNKDNDCNGTIDDLLTKACYTGTAGTSGVGLCTAGTQTCAGGAWGTCSGEVTPSTEVCDNKDNDCDGKTDETLSRSCYSGASGTKGVGLCQAGTQTCVAGQWDKCAGEVTPTAEVCDNKDNDCDGKTDETLSRSCYSGTSGTQGVGLCKAGTQTCAAGQWDTCAGEVIPATEACDNKDNDCDGKTDETLSRSCYSGAPGTKGVGLCKAGSETCAAGAWGACAGAVVPATEVCDNKDNDCDGKTDETWTNCGTSGLAKVYQCAGDYVQQQYVTRGCSGGSCFANKTWNTIKPCGGGQYNNCGAWSYYCSGSTRKRNRTCDKRGCASAACFDTAWTHDESVQSCGSGSTTEYRCSGSTRQRRTCTKGCSSGACTDTCGAWSSYQSCGSGSYNSCTSWSKYCSGSSVYQKRTCYKRGCSGTTCFNTAWTESQKIQTCSWGQVCSGSTCVCGPSPHFKVVGGKCLPSCGQLLHKKGLPDAGKGCCSKGCKTTAGGGPGATWDCPYCCSSSGSQQPCK